MQDGISKKNQKKERWRLFLNKMEIDGRGKNQSSRRGSPFIKGHKINLGKKREKYVKHKENPTSFKKGFTPWNKGIEMWKNREHPRGTLGKKLGPYSEEHKRKIGEANKGHIMSKKQKENLKKINTGRKVTEATKKKDEYFHKK